MSCHVLRAQMTSLIPSLRKKEDKRQRTLSMRQTSELWPAPSLSFQRLTPRNLPRLTSPVPQKKITPTLSAMHPQAFLCVISAEKSMLLATAPTFRRTAKTTRTPWRIVDESRQPMREPQLAITPCLTMPGGFVNQAMAVVFTPDFITDCLKLAKHPLTFTAYAGSWPLSFWPILV